MSCAGSRVVTERQTTVTLVRMRRVLKKAGIILPIPSAIFTSCIVNVWHNWLHIGGGDLTNQQYCS